MRCSMIMLAVVALATSGTAAKAQSTFEQQVLDELNYARANPAAYAEKLKQYRHYYKANLLVIPGAKSDYITEEGVAPVNEAIVFLERQGGLDRLDTSDRLAEAAADHCADQAGDGAVGHVGRDGSMPGDRVRRHGGGGYVSEVITYGSANAADVVRQLIVDDGVPDRGHRVAVYDAGLRFAGVKCGPHPEYETMCVVDLAETESGASRMQVASARYASRQR